MDPAAIFICAACTWIYGPWEDGGESRFQRCDCARADRPEETEIWPRFDFNLVVELCRCCGRELLRSGYKFAVWFCEPCRVRVVAFDRRCGATVIAIGRHSIMAGVGLRGHDLAAGAPLDEVAQKFRDKLRDLFASQDHLVAWRDRLVKSHLNLLGSKGDVAVADYLAELQRLADEGVQSLDKENRFASLCGFFLEE